ncbi:MAG: HAD family phosphatase [Bacteriovoracaceae bacterium]|nr:HAD family phosphatase [Bacteroidota bacterium]
MSVLKVILFDLGRVLMHIDFDAFPNGLGLTTQEQRLPYTGLTKKIVRKYEEGKISTNEFLDAMVPVYNYRFSREQILNAFNDIIVEDNQDIIAFVEEVRAKYRLGVLSNTCACHWEKVERISSIIKIFPDLFTSFHLGVMKPDPIIYQRVCETISVAPDQVLFIDDLKENVVGAQTFGMKGIVFQNSEQLKSDFSLRKW